ncbi:MAG TPA: hypothetical protein DCF49_01860 [Lachnospiraceae bacterium]|nr:hypothetical protein [Lachnospiraceae bacterium]
MKKRVLIILITCILGSANVLSPALYTRAADPQTDSQEDAQTEENGQSGKDGGILERGKEIGEDLYRKADEAVDGFDKDSLRRNIREALKEMDERGISPSVIAERTFGIKTRPELRGQTPGDTLIKDAQNVVRKKTEGFFTVLWDGFLDFLGSLIETGFSLAGGGKEAAK